MAKSILQFERECYVCRKRYCLFTTVGLEEHHVFPGVPGRALSERYGLKVWLCRQHHNLPPNGVHFDPELMEWLKQEGQRAFEKKNTRLEFLSLFGENHL